MSKDDIVKRDEESVAEDLQAKYSAVQHENRKLKNQIGRVETKRKETQKLLDLVTSIEDVNPSPPIWTVDPPKNKHHAIATILITDTHFDEVIEPNELMGLNKYNREIAEQRLQRAFERGVTIARDYLGAQYIYDGAVVLFGGDIVSGDIHDELMKTNVAPTPETVEYFLDPMLAGLKLLREEFGKVHCVGVVGNHDRLQKRKPAKKRAKDSWTWLFYKILAREFKRHSTVTFDVPEAPEVTVPIYDTRFQLHHGDDFYGGSGISGALAPLMLGDHRKRRRQFNAARATGNRDLEFDYQIMGHFHQRIILPGIIVGGCLKGYDEYARSRNFDYAPPSQELLIVTPENGVTFNAPIWVEDRESEGW